MASEDLEDNNYANGSMEVEDEEEQEEEEEEEEEEEDEDMSDNDTDSSDYSSEEEVVDMGHGNLLQNALFPPADDAVDNRTPLERWNDYVIKIRTRRVKVLKFVNVQLEGELEVMSTFAPVFIGSDNNVNNNNNNNNNDQDGRGQETTHDTTTITSWFNQLLDAVTTAALDPQDSSLTGYLTHAILGTEMLRLLGPEGQRRLFMALVGHHYKTLSFLQLKGIPDPPIRNDMPPPPPPTNGTKVSVLSMPAIIGALAMYETPALSEIELLGVTFSTMASVQEWSSILERRRGVLRQVNLVGMEPPEPTILGGGSLDMRGWLDPILLALAAPNADTATPLDELKLVGGGTRQQAGVSIPYITPHALSTLLQFKKKWWRLSLDGMGLQDEHLHVLTTMFRRDDACKAGDLLSLERNPNISSWAYEEFFEGCFFWKRRMGLIKVDDKDWEARFDLVRSMNNLHNRLDYVVSTGDHDSNETPSALHSTKPGHHHHHHHHKYTCSFGSRIKWVEWLAKLGTGLAWEDDKHRLNYLWFTLLEHPEFIYSHE